MYSIFDSLSRGHTGVLLPAKFSILRRRLRTNTIRVLKHLRQSAYAVSVQHPLVRILTTLNANPEMDMFEFHRLVNARSERIARGLRLTTPGNAGDVVTDRLFYGRGTVEIVTAINEDLDLLTLEKDWKRLQPVKVLSHPYTDLSHTPLDGTKRGVVDGVAVIQIDIVALAMQWYMWYHEQIEMGAATMRTFQQYVMQYPLGNAIATHHEIAYFNRLTALYRGDPVDAFENDWPIHLLDLSDQVDAFLLDRCAYLLRRSRRYEDLLKEIPALYAGDFSEVLRLPRVPSTRQITWVLTLARIDALGFLAQVDYETGGSRNRQDAALLKQRFRQLETAREMDVGLGQRRAKRTLTWMRRNILAYL